MNEDALSLWSCLIEELHSRPWSHGFHDPENVSGRALELVQAALSGERVIPGLWSASIPDLWERVNNEGLRWGTFGPTAIDAWVWKASNITALPGKAKRAMQGFDRSCAELDEQGPSAIEGELMRLQSEGVGDFATRCECLPVGNILGAWYGAPIVSNHPSLGRWMPVRGIYAVDVGEDVAEGARAFAARNRSTYLASLFLGAGTGPLPESITIADQIAELQAFFESQPIETAVRISLLFAIESATTAAEGAERCRPQVTMFISVAIAGLRGALRRFDTERNPS